MILLIYKIYHSERIMELLLVRMPARVMIEGENPSGSMAKVFRVKFVYPGLVRT